MSSHTEPQLVDLTICHPEWSDSGIEGSGVVAVDEAPLMSETFEILRLRREAAFALGICHTDTGRGAPGRERIVGLFHVPVRQARD